MVATNIKKFRTVLDFNFMKYSMIHVKRAIQKTFEEILFLKKFILCYCNNNNIVCKEKRFDLRFVDNYVALMS